MPLGFIIWLDANSIVAVLKYPVVQLPAMGDLLARLKVSEAVRATRVCALPMNSHNISIYTPVDIKEHCRLFILIPLVCDLTR